MKQLYRDIVAAIRCGYCDFYRRRQRAIQRAKLTNTPF